MKKLINEVKRMQKLAGILKENNSVDNIKWSYPEVDPNDDFYYEPNPEEGGYTVHLPVKGTDSRGNSVDGVFITTVPEISREAFDDLDFDPSRVEIADGEEREREKILDVVQDNYGISDAVQEFLGWDEEEAENADGTNWDDVVDAIMEDPELKAQFLDDEND